MDIIEYLSFTIRGTRDSIEKTQNVLSLMGRPERKLRNVIYIVGEVGKTSVARYISSILIEARYKVNSYLNSSSIPQTIEHITLADGNKKKIIECITLVQKICNEKNILLNHKELITVAAIMAFSKTEHDATIIETTSNEKSNPTNIFDFELPIATVICTIYNEEFHGSFITAPEIKAINTTFAIKPLSLIISGVQHKNINHLFEEIATKHKNKIVSINKDFWIDTDRQNSDFITYSSGQNLLSIPVTKGIMEYQKNNIALAIACVIEIQPVFINIGIRQITNAIANTKILGQMDKVLDKGVLEKLPRNSEAYINFAPNATAAIEIRKFCEKKNATEAIFKGNYLIIKIHQLCDVVHFFSQILKTFKLVIVILSNNHSLDKRNIDIVIRCGISVKEAESIEDAVSIVANHAQRPCRVIICNLQL